VQPDLPRSEELSTPLADPQCLVIPEEDPYRVINETDSDEGSDENDEDEDPQLLEDGIGGDDDDDDDDVPSRKFSPLPRPLPIWSKKAFYLRVEDSSHRLTVGLMVYPRCIAITELFGFLVQQPISCFKTRLPLPNTITVTTNGCAHAATAIFGRVHQPTHGH
jgi:hypothetical protein